MEIIVAAIRVILPFHLRNLAKVDGEVKLDLNPPRAPASASPDAASGDSEITIDSVLSRLEEKYPMLRGTIRDHGTLKRRPFVRYFACEKDLSLQPPETPLPEEVATGKEPFMVIGAIAGG